MCFSATASLVAGGVLSVAGAATIAQVKTKRELPLATIPLLFGVQQLIDGAVWLSFGVPLMNSIAAYAYGLFAFAFWPIFVPFAIMRIETVKVRREIMDALLLVGFGVGLFFLYYIITGAVTARVVNHCIAYSTPHPYLFGSLAFYLVATAGPFFVSSKKMLNTFGIVLLISFAIAGWFYAATFPSVWCFFAAIMSAMIYWYFRKSSRSPARA